MARQTKKRENSGMSDFYRQQEYDSYKRKRLTIAGPRIAKIHGT
jgi:hypothetical protein